MSITSIIGQDGEVLWTIVSRFSWTKFATVWHVYSVPKMWVGTFCCRAAAVDYCDGVRAAVRVKKLAQQIIEQVES